MNRFKTCLAVLALPALLAPSSAFAGFSESFACPPYSSGDPLPGYGQPSPPWPANMTWQTTNSSGAGLGRIFAGGTSGIVVMSDPGTGLGTGTPDETYISGLSYFTTSSKVTFAFDIKAPMTSNFTSFDWWTLNVYTDSGYCLLSWNGYRHTPTVINGIHYNAISLTTPNGFFPDLIIANNDQIHIRTDIDFGIKALQYSFDGTRPPQHPSPPAGIGSILIGQTGVPLYAGYDDVFNGVSDLLLGTKIDKIEIISRGLTTSSGAVEGPIPQQEHLYMNNFTLDDITPQTPPIAGRTPPSGNLLISAGTLYRLGYQSYITLSALAVTESPSALFHYMWDLNNDGIFETNIANSSNSECVLDYGYATATDGLNLDVGTHTIRLMVTDSLGEADTVYTTLQIAPDPATLSLLALGGLALLRRRK